MGTFKKMEYKPLHASTPISPSSNLLLPSRPFAPLPISASQQVSPVTQAQLDHTAQFGHSFEQVSIFPSEKKNNTGLPDALKHGVERLSGMSMDGVKVHYHSSKPAQIQALAYTQGKDIYVGPGQEKHLPHEAWHVVQQSLGQVNPTLQAKGMAINDDAELEREADVMGERASSIGMSNQDGVMGRHLGMQRQTHATNAREIGQRKCNCSQEEEVPSTSTVVQRTCYNPVPEGPYANLPEDKSIVDNKEFTDKQADAILAANKQHIGWMKFADTPIYRSDLSGDALLHGSITRPAEATVDHILPYESGGCNSVKNAQILSSTENSAKGKQWPWGKYTNYKKYVS